MIPRLWLRSARRCFRPKVDLEALKRAEEEDIVLETIAVLEGRKRVAYSEAAEMLSDLEAELLSDPTGPQLAYYLFVYGVAHVNDQMRAGEKARDLKEKANSYLSDFKQGDRRADRIRELLFTSSPHLR